MSARLVLIAAVDSMRGVGKDGGIPWDASEDLKRFRSLTRGGAVAYGRRTWESLPEKNGGSRYLAARYNILLTRHARVNPLRFDPTGSVASSVYEALHIAEAQAQGPLFVIGGRQAWEEALDLAKRRGVPTSVFLTRIKGDFKCDTFFPELPGSWTLAYQGPAQYDGSGRELETYFQIWNNF